MSKTILIVDDEITNRDLFGQILRTRNYHIEEAETGQGALTILKEKRVDLVLLDLFMPDGDGFVVTRAVRGDETLKQIPIVVITAAANEDIHEKMLAAGCNELIRKPIDMKRLLRTVAKYLKEDEG